MKKYHLIVGLCTLMGCASVLAQNSTVAPDFLQLPHLTLNPTCAAADKGKMYYNSTENRFYLCNGTVLQSLTTRAFPNIISITSSGDALSLTNLGTGNSFETSGKLRFFGIGHAANRVLTSDATGNATWQDLPSVIAFRANADYPISKVIANNVETLLTWNAEFDFGSKLNTLQDFYTAAVDGTYHFDVSVKWGEQGNVVNTVETRLKKCDAAGNNCTLIATDKLTNQFAPNQTMSITTQLLANETVKVFVLQKDNGGANRVIEGSNELATFWSGHLVR